MKNVILAEIRTLKSHENIRQRRLSTVMRQIKKDRMIKNPVVMEKKHMVILDGHHRTAALKLLKMEFVPVYYVSYSDRKVQVGLRRKNLHIKNIKRAVIDMALSRKIFPYKTTKHTISHIPVNINIPLDELAGAKTIKI